MRLSGLSFHCLQMDVSDQSPNPQPTPSHNNLIAGQVYFRILFKGDKCAKILYRRSTPIFLRGGGGGGGQINP